MMDQVLNLQLHSSIKMQFATCCTTKNNMGCSIKFQVIFVYSEYKPTKTFSIKQTHRHIKTVFGSTTKNAFHWSVLKNNHCIVCQ